MKEYGTTLAQILAMIYKINGRKTKQGLFHSQAVTL